MTRGWSGLDAAVLLGALLLGLVSWNASVRSPDGEVMFELCASLLDQGSLAVDGVSTWRGFGLAPGRDGRRYPVFGPAESVACIPELALARVIDATRWYEAPALSPNPSYSYTNGLAAFAVGGVPLEDPGGHAARALADLTNVWIGALAVFAFWRLSHVYARRPSARLAATALLALGTPLWWYQGSFFSEPLSTLLLLCGFLLLHDPRGWRPIAAGALLGLSVSAHVTGLLALPFLLAALVFLVSRERLVDVAGRVATGLVPALLALALYDHVRFGEVLETGRSVDASLAASFGYGHLVEPWRGLYGLLISPGKGLLVYAPACVLGLVAWPSLRRRSAGIADLLLAMIVARVAFLATRSDWAGGFCLGPRLLVPALPFVLLPVGPWLDERVERRSGAAIVLFGFALLACAIEQGLFVTGEPHLVQVTEQIGALSRGIDLTADDALYLRLAHAPLVHLLDPGAATGSWLLARIPGDAASRWLSLGCVVALGVVAPITAGLWRDHRRG